MRRIEKKRFSRKLKVVFLTVLIGAGYLFFESAFLKKGIVGIENTYNHIADKAHFVLDQVFIKGRNRTSQASIEALKLKPGSPIFDIDLTEKREKLLALPWVQEVSIERHLPATLVIQITEKEPIALWQNGGKYFPLDQYGYTIQDNQTPLDNMILIVGRDAPEKTPKLIQILEKYPKIREKVRSAVRVGERRWNLILFNAEDGLEIRLPEEGTEEALLRLMALNESEKILKKNLKMIDLRYPNRLPIKLKEGVK